VNGPTNAVAPACPGTDTVAPDGGPGTDAVAPDGSPVEVFARLPAQPAAGYVLAALPDGCDVLELGCGAGRLTRALTDAGHNVVAVDESAAMLDRVAAGAERVLADAAGLDLGRSFPAVLLASYLVNDPDRGAAFLAVAARHLAPGGRVVVQRYDPAWVARAEPGEATVGPVTIAVTRLVPGPGRRFEATVAYSVDGHRWEQEIAAAVLDDEALEALAADAGLTIAAWLDEHRTWAVLTPRPAGDG
jgi:SAM-dependent methyltransferase